MKKTMIVLALCSSLLLLNACGNTGKNDTTAEATVPEVTTVAEETTEETVAETTAEETAEETAGAESDDPAQFGPSSAAGILGAFRAREGGERRDGRDDQRRRAETSVLHLDYPQRA